MSTAAQNKYDQIAGGLPADVGTRRYLNYRHFKPPTSPETAFAFFFSAGARRLNVHRTTSTSNLQQSGHDRRRILFAYSPIAISVPTGPTAATELQQ
jgi:hypothetical protein